MSQAAARPRTSRLSGDRGAVLVEAALLSPMFVLLIFGLIEFGGAYRDSLTLQHASSAGSRQATIEGNSSHADWNIVEAVQDAASAMPSKQLVKVVIFRASGPTSTVPAACLTAGVFGTCNFYGPTELALVTEPASWGDCTGPTGNFCPAFRNVEVGTPGPDYVGIYVEAIHPWLTGFFGSQIRLTDTATVRLEPSVL